jgi:hypothetical protein
MKMLIMLATATICFALSGKAQSNDDNNGNEVFNSTASGVSGLAKDVAPLPINAPATYLLEKTANEIDQGIQSDQNSNNINENTNSSDNSSGSGSSWFSSGSNSDNSSQSDTNSDNSSDTNSDNNEPPLNK